MNTKWRFHNLKNMTVFAALLKEVCMGCKKAVLPEPLPKNYAINYLTLDEKTRPPFNDDVCHFRGLTLHLHGNQLLEKNFEIIQCIHQQNVLTEPQSNPRGPHERYSYC